MDHRREGRGIRRGIGDKKELKEDEVCTVHCTILLLVLFSRIITQQQYT